MTAGDNRSVQLPTHLLNVRRVGESQNKSRVCCLSVHCVLLVPGTGLSVVRLGYRNPG